MYSGINETNINEYNNKKNFTLMGNIVYKQIFSN